MLSFYVSKVSTAVKKIKIKHTYVSSWTLQFKKLILEKWHGHAGHPPLLHRFAVIAMTINAKKTKINLKISWIIDVKTKFVKLAKG